MKRLLLWDFDHTLAWREGGFSAAIAKVLASEEPDLIVARQAISAHLQRGFPWHTPERAHPELADTKAWWAALRPIFAKAIAAQGVGSQRAQELGNQVRDVYLSPEYWRLYDDTLETMARLQDAGWTQVVFSNHVPELPWLVGRLGLMPHLVGVLCSAETGYEKPHPRSYDLAWERYGPAAKVCMVGDSLRCDVLPPLDLGWQAILVHWNERGDKPDPRAPIACRALSEVVALLL